jgi:predicted nucleic acid-binding protein
MQLYVDTNVFYLALRPPVDAALAAWVRGHLDRFESGDDAAVTSPLVLDELAYRLLLALVRDAGDPDPLTALRKRTEAVLAEHAARVATLVETVARLPGLTVVGTDRRTAEAALVQMRRHRLLPRGAHHVAIASIEGCDAILSTDPDFARAAATMRWIGPDDRS